MFSKFSLVIQRVVVRCFVCVAVKALSAVQVEVDGEQTAGLLGAVLTGWPRYGLEASPRRWRVFQSSPAFCVGTACIAKKSRFGSAIMFSVVQ